MKRSTELFIDSRSYQLLSLLDLKQKQAGIAEALASVEYARQQAEQSKETARQGRALMLFTVVTILFVGIPCSS